MKWWVPGPGGSRLKNAEEKYAQVESIYRGRGEKKTMTENFNLGVRFPGSFYVTFTISGGNMSDRPVHTLIPVHNHALPDHMECPPYLEFWRKGLRSIHIQELYSKKTLVVILMMTAWRMMCFCSPHFLGFFLISSRKWSLPLVASLNFNLHLSIERHSRFVYGISRLKLDLQLLTAAFWGIISI